jgi:hypothetical protein
LRGLVVVNPGAFVVKKRHACIKLSRNTEQKTVVIGGKKISLYAKKHMGKFTDKLVGIYWKSLLVIP